MSAFDDADYVDPEPFIRSGRRVPPVLHGPSKKVRDARWEAQRSVHQMAVVLILCAAIGIVTGLFVLLVAPTGRNATTRALIGLAVVVWYCVVAFGAIEMDRLGSYNMAKLGCFMALVPIPVPTYPILFFTGLFAIMRLNNPKVQRHFRAFQTASE